MSDSYSDLSVLDQGEALLRQADKRRFLYASLETLLTHNRLVMAARPVWSNPPVGFVFRTLTSEDKHHLQARVFSSSNFDSLRWGLAYHTWMINGVEFETYSDTQHIYNFFYKNLHRQHVRVLQAYVQSLDIQTSRALASLESYCYEYYSRHLWRTLKPVLLSGISHHYVRQLWRAFNESEDQREQDEKDWVHTRTLVSAQAPKGAKALEKATKNWEAKEERRRAGVIERYVNFIIQGPEKDRPPITIMIRGKKVVVPEVRSSHTIEEMEAEMQRHLAGEKDLHDLAIDEYFGNIRNAREKRKSEAQAKRVQAAATQQTQVGTTGKTVLQGYTPEQLKAIKGKVRNPSVSAPSINPATEHLFNRYLDNDVFRIAEIGPSGLPQERSSSQEKPQSLQDKIEGRKVPYKE